MPSEAERRLQQDNDDLSRRLHEAELREKALHQQLFDLRHATGPQAEAQMPQAMNTREMSTGEKLRAMGQDAHKSADDFNTLAELYESLEPGGRRERALKRLLVDAFRLIGPPL